MNNKLKLSLLLSVLALSLNVVAGQDENNESLPERPVKQSFGRKIQARFNKLSRNAKIGVLVGGAIGTAALGGTAHAFSANKMNAYLLFKTSEDSTYSEIELKDVTDQNYSNVILIIDGHECNVSINDNSITFEIDGKRVNLSKTTRQFETELEKKAEDKRKKTPVREEQEDKAKSKTVAFKYEKQIQEKSNGNKRDQKATKTKKYSLVLLDGKKGLEAYNAEQKAAEQDK